MGFMDRVKHAAESAQAATSKVGVGASAGQMDLANRAQTVRPAAGGPYETETNQYIYPSAPFAEGDQVSPKVAPDNPNEVMIFGKA